MGKLKDLTGQRFGRLTVIGRAGKANDGHIRWKCRCDCGNECEVIGKDLRRGHTQSCGCLHKDVLMKDLKGKRFGRLTAIEAVGVSKEFYVLWRCVCDCGNEHITTSSRLVSGECKSCGCLVSEIDIARLTTHEMSRSKIYCTWAGMKQRCYNIFNKSYQRYGGRGIIVCDEWRDDFVAFYNYVSKLEHFGEEGYSLDRIDNDGNYEPGNIRWATIKEQARNKRSNTIVEYSGVKMTLAEASERSGISKFTLIKRMRRGLAGEKLFSTMRQR